MTALTLCPGLIEGASYNLGMGHRFLKHVERCSILLFIVDINGFQFKADSPHRSAVDTVRLLCQVSLLDLGNGVGQIINIFITFRN